MRRSPTITLTILAVLLAASLAWAGPMAPDDMRLAPPAGWPSTKPCVEFSHASHSDAKIDCTICHHTWDGKGPIQSCSAAGCHDQQGKTGPQALYAAFHAKDAQSSCLGCHKTANARDGANLPVGCKDCHARKGDGGRRGKK
ncbi:MAG: cytochrome c3 family protein [Pseudodesulfovibrio sp.]